MPKIQSIYNKKSEVAFRKKLAEQFEGKKIVYPGEPRGEEYTEIVKDRVKDYTKYFNELKRSKILQGPFLEIGAGVGQGAMLLENTYNLQGFTSDISLETLKLAPKYKKVLGYKKMPLRICADLYNLPFRTGSIPFIFTFQTLHHLPDPYPALKEIKRVLTPGGYFYFNEEPVAQRFNLNLWRRDRHLRWFEKVLKYLIVLHFISRIGKSETEHNILEETFTLDTWEKAVNIFEKAEIELKAFPFGPAYKINKTKKKGWIKTNLIKRLILEILGGGISAICQKAGNTHISHKQDSNLIGLLACPNCKSKPQLYFENKDQSFYCERCKSVYKNKNGIILLLTNKDANILYPNK